MNSKEFVLDVVKHECMYGVIEYMTLYVVCLQVSTHLRRSVKK